MLAEQRQRRRAQRRRGDDPDQDQPDEPGLRARPCPCHKRQRNERRAGDRGHDADEDAQPAGKCGDLVGGNAHRGVGHGEDRLIQHQDEDHGRGRDTDVGGELWQVDHVGGPAEREHQLQHGKIDAGAVGAGLGLQLGRGHVRPQRKREYSSLTRKGRGYRIVLRGQLNDGGKRLNLLRRTKLHPLKAARGFVQGTAPASSGRSAASILPGSLCA